MKEQHIEFKEMETNYLESDKEKKPYSWQEHVHILWLKSYVVSLKVVNNTRVQIFWIVTFHYMK